MEIALDAAQFQQRLAQTIAWCSWCLACSIEERGELAWSSRVGAPEILLPADLAGCLRSAELKPDDAFDYAAEQRLAAGDIDVYRFERVEALAQERAGLLHQAGRPIAARDGNLAGGRILVYEPDTTLMDGASQAETKGYIDGEGSWEDVPPWDSWLTYVRSPHRSFLLSHVPASLVAMVDSGIWVNCSGCLFWLDAPEDLHDQQRIANTKIMAQITALMHQ